MSKVKVVGFGAYSLGETLSGTLTTIYAAVGNTDPNSGKGNNIDKSYHLTESDAKIGANSVGVMGHPGKVEPRLAVDLSKNEGERSFLILPAAPVHITDTKEAREKIREEALGKLSEAQKAALFDQE